MNRVVSPRRWTLPVLWGGLVTIALASGWHYRQAVQSAASAAANYQQCQALAARIHSLRDRPTQATLVARTSGEWAGPIEAAAREAGLAPAQILRIEPQAPRRLADTDYEEQTAVVELEAATIPQVIRFLHAVTSPAQQLGARSLRLATPQRAATAESAELWTAEVTLNSFVFAPKMPTPNR